mgnify:CR=1 FL=1
MAVNVLIVDDSAVMRAMIQKTMKLSGLQLGEIHQAANGRRQRGRGRRTWCCSRITDGAR